MTDATATMRAPILGFDEPEHEREHEYEIENESESESESNRQQNEDVHAAENDESYRQQDDAGVYLNVTEMENENEIESEIENEINEEVDDDITSLPPPPKFGHPLWIYTLPGILAWPIVPTISTIVSKLTWIILPLTLLMVALVALFVVTIEILERWMMGKLRFSYNNGDNSSEPGLMVGVQMGGNGGDRSRSKFAVVGRIERSLRKREFGSIRWEEEHAVQPETEKDECESECQCQNENECETNHGASSPATNGCRNSKVPAAKQVRRVRCCAICLEDFRPGDDIVSSIDDCCTNNVFHRGCITTWWVKAASRSNVYGSNDGDGDNVNDNGDNESSPSFRCPCCRQPIRSRKRANEGEEREAYVVHMRSEYRAKMEAATRRQNRAVEAYMRREREAAGEDSAAEDSRYYLGLNDSAARANHPSETPSEGPRAAAIAATED